MATTTVDRSPASRDVRSPSVLVVLVIRDAVAWLRGCLESLAAQTYRLPAIDSVSISRVTPNVFPDNRLRAYNNPSASFQDVVGLYQFDLSVIPDSSVIQSMTLTLWMENQFGSPSNGPG